MTREFQIIRNPQDLVDKLDDQLRQPDTANALMADLGGGLLKFSEAVFPELDRDKIYVHKFQRPPQGTGPHLDTHSNIVDTSYPWIGIFNLSGNSHIRTVRIPED